MNAQFAQSNVASMYSIFILILFNAILSPLAVFASPPKKAQPPLICSVFELAETIRHRDLQMIDSPDSPLIWLMLETRATYKKLIQTYVLERHMRVREQTVQDLREDLIEAVHSDLSETLSTDLSVQKEASRLAFETAVIAMKTALLDPELTTRERELATLGFLTLSPMNPKELALHFKTNSKVMGILIIRVKFKLAHCALKALSNLEALSWHVPKDLKELL